MSQPHVLLRQAQVFLPEHLGLPQQNVGLAHCQIIGKRETCYLLLLIRSSSLKGMV
jgi:hypothetical protein